MDLSLPVTEVTIFATFLKLSSPLMQIYDFGVAC